MKKLKIFFSKLALRREISLFPYLQDVRGYSFKFFKSDLSAGFTVALLAIPQSIAYSLLAGLPPTAGLFSAIFGAIFTAVFGASRYLVAGPSTGVAILIQTSIANVLNSYYPQVSPMERDILIMHILTQIVLLMGSFQILAGLFNFGKLLQFVSRSVVLGYFAGMMIAIFVGQLFYLLGIPPVDFPSSVIVKGGYLLLHITKLDWETLFIGILSIFVLIFLRRHLKKFPGALLMLIIMGTLTYLINRYLFWEKFPMHIDCLYDMEGFSIPSVKFIFPLLDFKVISQIFPAALAITLLAILEVFSISRGLAAKSGEYAASNQQMMGLGISNAVLSFIRGAMPASGSISRSLLNLENRAKTCFSALFSGVFVAFLIIFFWPFVKHIPLAALAGLLIVMIPTLLDVSEVKLCFEATRGDALVFLLTVGSCLIFSLDVAFFVGIVISIASYLNRAAVPRLVEYAFNSAGRLVIISPKKKVYRKVRIIGIGGELFFGAVDLFQNTLQAVAEDPYVEVIVLRLNAVHYVDASICFAILRVHEYLKTTKRHLMISGISEEVWQVFRKTHLVEKLGRENLFFTDETRPQFSTWRACQRAEVLISQE